MHACPLTARGRLSRRPLLPLLAIVTTIAVLSPATPTTAAAAVPMTTVQARQSDRLVNMSGINTKLVAGNSPYGDFARTKSLLLALGVRHIREQWASNRPDHDVKLNELADAGVTANLIINPGNVDTSELRSRAAEIATNVPNAVDSIEPPNEWNLHGGNNWAPELRAFQRAMYAAVRAQPELNDVRILGPALGRREGYAELGDLSDVADAGNIHLYPGGQVPSNRVDEQLTNEQMVVGAKVKVVTEAGFHNDLDSAATHFPTSEAAAAIYTPRLYLEYFRRGVPRLYLYELFDYTQNVRRSDHESHFGLIRRDGSRKPAFNALSNFLALADDRGEPFRPGVLEMSVDAGSEPVTRVLLQRRNGQFVLFLYRDVSVWDHQARVTTSVPPVDATVRLGRSFSRLEVIHPTFGTRPVSTTRSASSVTVPLRGDVVAIVLTP